MLIQSLKSLPVMTSGTEAEKSRVSYDTGLSKNKVSTFLMRTICTSHANHLHKDDIQSEAGAVHSALASDNEAPGNSLWSHDARQCNR